jgi:hypothetical protein
MELHGGRVLIDPARRRHDRDLHLSGACRARRNASPRGERWRRRMSEEAAPKAVWRLDCQRPRRSNQELSTLVASATPSCFPAISAGKTTFARDDPRFVKDPRLERQARPSR